MLKLRYIRMQWQSEESTHNTNGELLFKDLDKWPDYYYGEVIFGLVSTINLKSTIHSNLNTK